MLGWAPQELTYEIRIHKQNITNINTCIHARYKYAENVRALCVNKKGHHLHYSDKVSILNNVSCTRQFFPQLLCRGFPFLPPLSVSTLIARTTIFRPPRGTRNTVVVEVIVSFINNSTSHIYIYICKCTWLHSFK